MRINSIITSIFFAATALTAASESTAEPLCLRQWDIDGAKLSREGDRLFKVDFNLDLDKLNVPSEEAVLFTPVLYNGNDSIELRAIGIYGRNRYFHYQRRGTGMLSGSDDETVIKNADRPDHIDYSNIIEYMPWMNGSRLKVKAECYGCCFTLLGENSKEKGRFMEPDFKIAPKYVFEPGDSVITGELDGSARVQFIVDKWDLHSDKFDNYRELGKITHSIDTVKNDPDLTITEVWLKGFASPEATWQHNTMLAKNRTQAVKDYIQNLYKFAPGIIQTDYQPEDWAGLREWVDNSNIPNRQAILDIIDEPVADPNTGWDAKENKLRRLYPADRKMLLNTVYPPLRHTEYKIKYKVRKFIDKEEIRRVMRTNPRRLTLNDFNIAADGYAPGSPEFVEVYEIAAGIYPDSPLANLNSANAALQAGNIQLAETRLAKAGDYPEANYSRGLLEVMKGNYAQALPFIEQGAANGIDGAQELLDDINAYLQFLREE